MRAICRETGITRNTCARLLLRFGRACQNFLDREMRDLELRHIQVDEMWAFVRKKEFNLTGEEPDYDRIGEYYIFVALDEDSRLVPAHLVARRHGEATEIFLAELAGRLKWPKPHESDDDAYKRRQYKPITRISTDAWQAYAGAVKMAFGPYAEYAQIVKRQTSKKEREATGKWVDVNKRVLYGRVDEKDISTSLVERNNLTTRQFIRRLTRKTNAFSRKLEHLVAAVALHFAFYNYCWIISTFRTTPAVMAGIADRPLSWSDFFDHVRNCSPQTVPVG